MTDVSIARIPSGIQHAMFEAARQVMLQRLADWIHTHPDRELLDAEVEATVSAMRQSVDAILGPTI